ncbi:MAG: hypothetical protein ACREXY_18895, partial [Gammaproteobacteria bacterium]
DVWLYLYKNGSQVSLLDFESGPLSSSYESVAGADIQRLEAGDYIDIRVQQNQSAGSAARTIDTSALASYVSIIRLVTDL